MRKPLSEEKEYLFQKASNYNAKLRKQTQRRVSRRANAHRAGYP